jgi:hypothetical protein
MSPKRSKIHPRSSLSAPVLTDIVPVVVFILALASGAQMLSIDSDLGRHLTLGNYILDHRIVPTRDLFSHTLLGQPRPPYEWLSQILFALSHRLLNLDGVILLASIFIAVTFTLTFQFANRRSKSLIIAMIVTFLAVGASSLHWLPRPHIITFLLLAIWIEKLEQLRKGEPVRLFVFPLLMLLWANLHGGFVFGILAWVAYFAGWRWDRWQKRAEIEAGKNLFIAGIASLSATIITPDLWRNWEAVLNNRSAFILSRTVETMPPVLTDTAILPFTLLLLLTSFSIIRLKNLSASHIFLLTGLGLAALLMSRNIPLFAIASAPILTELIKDSLAHFKTWTHIKERFSNFGTTTNFVIPIVLILLTAGYFASHYIKTGTSIYQFNPQVFPVHAMDWLENNPQQGRMFNEVNWGGYILHRTWSRQLVFLDSQSDFYGEKLMRDYEQIMTAQKDWENLLKPVSSGLGDHPNRIAACKHARGKIGLENTL